MVLREVYSPQLFKNKPRIAENLCPGSRPHSRRYSARGSALSVSSSDSSARSPSRALTRLRVAALPSPAPPIEEQPSQGSRYFRRRVRVRGSSACAAPVPSRLGLLLLTLLLQLPTPQPTAARSQRVIPAQEPTVPCAPGAAVVHSRGAWQ